MAPRPIITNPDREVFAQAPDGPSQSRQIAGLEHYIDAPYAGLAEAGAQLEKIGDELVKPEMEARGANAVGRDPVTGELTVEYRTPLNEWDVAYNHGAKAAFLSQDAGDTRIALQKLANDNIDDPDKFRQLATQYVKSRAGAAGVPTELRADILANGNDDITQFTTHLVNQKRTRDTQNQKVELQGQIDAGWNDVMALAHQGGTSTPDFQTALGKVRNLYGTFRNPIFGVSQAQIENDISEKMGAAEAEAAIGMALGEAKTHGVQAGLDFAEKALWSRDLNLTPAQREAYQGRAHREIGQWEALNRDQGNVAKQEVDQLLDDAAAKAERTGEWQSVISPDQIARAYRDNPAKGADLISRLNSSAMTYSMRLQVQTATPAQLREMNARLDPANSPAPKRGFDSFYSEFLAPHEGGFKAHDGAGGKPLYVAGEKPAGMTTQGNINLSARPVVKNADGSISTVRSITITEGNTAVLIPTVVGDKVVSNKDAIAEYKKTGKHLGKFSSEAQADAYASGLHEQQASAYGSPVNFGINQGANPDIDVSKLTPEKAKQLLHDRYWVKSGADQLDGPMGAVVGDTAVNMGVEASKDLLTQSGGDPQKYLDLRAQRYKDIAKANPAKAGDLPGWLARNEDLRNYITGGGFADRERTYQAFLKAVEGRNTALTKDPAGFVASSRQDIAAMLEAKEPQTFQTGIRNSILAQQQMGVTAPKVLTEGQAKGIVQQFNNPENPEKRADNALGIIGGLEQQYGKYFPQVMAELQKAGMPTEATVLAQVKDDPTVSFRMVNAINAGRSNLRKIAPQAEQIDKDVVTGLSAFSRTLAGQSGSSKIAAQQVEGAQLYAYQLASEGEANPGQRAVQDIIGKRYQFQNSYRVPAGIDAAQVSDGATLTLRNLPNSAIMAEGSLDPKLTPETRQTLSAQILKGRGVWLTMPDDSGLYLAYPQETGFVPGRRADGKMLSFTWSQLTQAAPKITDKDMIDARLKAMP